MGWLPTSARTIGVATPAHRRSRRRLTDSPEPSFRSIEPRDEAEVAALLDAAFDGDWPAYPIRVPPIEHLRWRLDAPGAVPGATTLLELDGRIVAFDGSVGHDVWVRGERRTGCIWVDSAVHPDFQGRGLSKRHLEHFIARWADVEQPVSIEQGSSNPRLYKSSGPGSDRRRVANTVEILARPVSRASILRRAVAHPSLASVTEALRAFKRPDAHRSEVQISEVDAFDERVDDLWMHARDDFDYAVVRDRAYLNWRYCDPRGGVYRARVAERGNLLAGFSVLSAPGPEVKIVDLLVASGERAALDALLADAIATARADGARAVSVQLPRVHPYRAALEAVGFASVESISNMGHRPRNDTLLDFLSTDPAARLHVAYGDSDHV